MGSMHLKDRTIGAGHPCFIIAEAGVNHNGSLEMALRLVDAAVEAGVDAVKFQKRHLQSLYPADLLANPNSAEWAFQYMLPILKQVELSDEEFQQIKAYCDEKSIRFMCTPWDEESLLLLENLDTELYKVASADLVNLPLLEKIVETGKPMILSTGMATLPEIEQTVCFLEHHRAAYALLHCVSTYPAPFEGLNLRFLETLKQFNVPIGYSGHERGISTPLIALTLGASIIEKHITLDRTLPGPDHAASLEPNGFQRMVRDIRNAELALGTPEKQLSTMELLNRQVLRKSLVAACSIRSGSVITRSMVKVKGPGKGLTPQRLHELVGTKLQRDMDSDDCFVESDLQTCNNTPLHTRKLQRTWGFKARFHDLLEILDKKPRLVELHFSSEDVNHTFVAPKQPYDQQLFIHAPEFINGKLLDLCTHDDTVWERSIALLQKTIDKAVELQPSFTGPVGIVVHVGGMSMDEPVANQDQLIQRAIDAFRRLDSKGTLLMPENLPPRPWYFGGQWFQNVFIRPSEMVEFVQELGLGMTLDLSHAQLYCGYYGDNLYHFVQRCLPYTKHLHLADASGIDGEGLQIGEGVIEWDEIMSLLSQQDFTWVPEIWSGHLDGAAGFAEAVNRLSKYEI
jgi:N-acetylneuraminate synthase